MISHKLVRLMFCLMTLGVDIMFGLQTWSAAFKLSNVFDASLDSVNWLRIGRQWHLLLISDADMSQN